MDLEWFGGYDEISPICADTLGQLSECTFDVSCNLVPLGVDEPGRDPGDHMLKGRAALQSDRPRPQLQPEIYQHSKQHQGHCIKKQPVFARRGSCRNLPFQGRGRPKETTLV
jgi:hypothetical protein